MKKDNFINLLKNKTQIERLETVELKSVIYDFPYFQNARALYLKGLKTQDSFKYNKELKITAAYTTDRKVLFDFITSKGFKTTQIESNQTVIKETSINRKDKITVDKKTETITQPNEIIEEQLNVGKPITFKSSENHSFNQWLQLSTKKPIIRNKVLESLKNDTDEKAKIIEKFIKKNPKIKPLAKDKSISISITKNKHDSSLMTETLAKVYLEQKKYENAIQAYRILSLKYPEKSGFFADQIKRIQILQKNKS